MPYADPEKQKAAMRERYRERYHSERGFKAKEKERKALHYATNERYRRRVKAKALARYYWKAAAAALVMLALVVSAGAAAVRKPAEAFTLHEASGKIHTIAVHAVQSVELRGERVVIHLEGRSYFLVPDAEFPLEKSSKPAFDCYLALASIVARHTPPSPADVAAAYDALAGRDETYLMMAPLTIAWDDASIPCREVVITEAAGGPMTALALAGGAGLVLGVFGAFVVGRRRAES